MNETVEKLLDAAEAQIRLKGFHAVSFRDLANETGIKSSSVHYHFPQKQDLGVALVNRYSENFFKALEEHAEGSKTQQEVIEAIYNAYKSALTASDRHCLCGVLGAETSGLPQELSQEVAGFFQANISWLANRMDGSTDLEERMKRATSIIAALQGAMMLSHSLGDHSVFDKARDLVLA